MIVFEYFREQLALGQLDLSSVDWRLVLLMTTSSVDVDLDAETVSDFATLGEWNGAGVARHTLTNVSVAINPTTHRVEVSADPVDVGVLVGGTSPIKGALLYLFGTDDTDSIPAIFVDESVQPGPAWPYTPIGVAITLEIAAEGFLVL